MLTSTLAHSIVALLCVGATSAVNLRNGPKSLAVDLGANSFVGSSSESHARRQLAMRGLADFDWDIMPEPDYPSISFEDANIDKEVRFLYNYTGDTTDPSKEIRYTLLRGDCEEAASTGAIAVSFSKDFPALKEYQLDINILQDTVTGTPEYTDIDATSAMINFCVRVDYVYIDALGNEEGVNFHETNVTINIDLTANFTLTAINVERIDADQIDEEAALNRDVQAYFCDDEYNKLTDPRFVQGDIMPVCVEIAPTDRFLYHLSDVMEMDLEQQKQLDPTKKDRSDIVLNQYAVGLSDKFCRNGICRMRHQLASKFFDERNPSNLDIEGVAICAFGPLSQYTRRVNRYYSQAYQTAHAASAIDLVNAASVEACKERCNTFTDCRSFSATPLDSGRFDCVLYSAAYPLDEELVVNTTSTMYLRNDPEAVVTVPQV